MRGPLINGEKQGSVINSTDRENEDSKIFNLSRALFWNGACENDVLNLAGRTEEYGALN